jgi:multiple antibiotic resistance protein
MMTNFCFLGDPLLKLLNVSIASLRFGGGILLMVLAVDMLSGMSRTKSVESMDEALIVPIATPLLVGPGTITTLIVLSVSEGFATTMLGVVIATVLVFLTLSSGELLLEKAGARQLSIRLAPGTYTLRINVLLNAKSYLNQVDIRVDNVSLLYAP